MSGFPPLEDGRRPGWVGRHGTQRSGQLRFSGDLEKLAAKRSKAWKTRRNFFQMTFSPEVNLPAPTAPAPPYGADIFLVSSAQLHTS
jgi:hypothetical protein